MRTSDCNITPVRAAAIDVGTNSVKLAVGELSSDGEFRSLTDASVNSRLGEGIDSTCRLSETAQERTLAAISQLLEKAKALGATKIRIVSTNAMRDAENGAEFQDKVKSELGHELVIISEEDEGRLSYSAVTRDSAMGRCDGEQAVIDIGGGSTEFIFGKGYNVEMVKSLRLGAVRITERFLTSNPPKENEIAESEKYIRGTILAGLGEQKPQCLAGVGGTIATTARIIKKIPPPKTPEVHGLKVSENEVQNILDMLCSVDLMERKQVVGLEPARADIIIGGMLIMQQAMRLLGVDALKASMRGLRYAVLYELLEIE